MTKDPDAGCAEGYALLHLAAAHTPTIRLALAHGADPDIRDRRGETPLSHAAGCGTAGEESLQALVGKACGRPVHRLLTCATTPPTLALVRVDLNPRLFWSQMVEQM